MNKHLEELLEAERRSTDDLKAKLREENMKMSEEIARSRNALCNPVIRELNNYAKILNKYVEIKGGFQEFNISLKSVDKRTENCLVCISVDDTGGVKLGKYCESGRYGYEKSRTLREDMFHSTDGAMLSGYFLDVINLAENWETVSREFENMIFNLITKEFKNELNEERQRYSRLESELSYMDKYKENK